MSFNPRKSGRPLPLALVAPFKFASIALYSPSARDKMAILIAPLGTYPMQRKVGYLLTWAIGFGYQAHISQLTKAQAISLLPSNCLHLPVRNFCIIQHAPLLDAYEEYVKTTGIDIPAEITHTSDIE